MKQACARRHRDSSAGSPFGGMLQMLTTWASTSVPPSSSGFAHRRTPRARPFRAAGEIVADEHRHMRAAPASPRQSPRVGVVKRQVERLNSQPEQPVGAIRRPPRIIASSLEIRLQLRLVQIMLGQPPLFG